jgi:dihydroxyacetone kinase
MLDTLLPFASVFADALEEGCSTEDALERAVRAAERGAEATASMLPKRGRSSYLGDRAIGHQDPGATAAAIWLRAMVSAI